MCLRRLNADNGFLGDAGHEDHCPWCGVREKRGACQRRDFCQNLEWMPFANIRFGGWFGVDCLILRFWSCFRFAEDLSAECLVLGR